MANKALEFHPEARIESRVSLSWYRRRSVRAAEEFFAELNRATDAIVDNPERWPMDASGFRQCRLRRFPFVVIYRDKLKVVQVIAVAHASRKPGYWKLRQS
jgi:plasmid stabilization system protein ParE